MSVIQLCMQPHLRLVIEKEFSIPHIKKKAKGQRTFDRFQTGRFRLSKLLSSQPR